jgi:hypothetical protein
MLYHAFLAVGIPAVGRGASPSQSWQGGCHPTLRREVGFEMALQPAAASAA